MRSGRRAASSTATTNAYVGELGGIHTDEDVDTQDQGRVQACLTGPAYPQGGHACADAPGKRISIWIRTISPPTAPERMYTLGIGNALE